MGSKKGSIKMTRNKTTARIPLSLIGGWLNPVKQKIKSTKLSEDINNKLP